MRYAVATHERHVHEVRYRYYVTDLLWNYTRGYALTRSFRDEMHPKAEDNRTVDEIVADVTRRAGLEVRE